MPWWWSIPVFGAFLASILASDVVRRLATRFGVVDRPDGGRKMHGRAVPLAGGLAIYVGVALPTLVVLVATDHFTSGAIGVAQFFGLLLGGLVLAVGGVIDDAYGLPPRASFAFPLAAAALATASGIGVAKLTNPFGDPFVLAPAVSALFTFAWLLCTTYTTKLLDGLDGLAATVAGLAALMVASLALTERFFQPDVALLASIVVAAVAGFLLWNVAPAALFLGEGGSTLLGFLIGALAVISGGKVATALLVLGIPALDVAVVIALRLRDGKNPFTSADRTHLHHLLLAWGLSQRQVVLAYGAVALLFGVSTLFLQSWQKLVALAILGVVAVLTALRLRKIL